MSEIFPVCFFQTKKIIVDDNQVFIDSLLLKNHGKAYSAFNSPTKALDYFLNEYQSVLPLSAILKTDANVIDSSHRQLVNIDIGEIQRYMNANQNRDISIIFVDYHMPDMTGVEFLRKIKHLPMKKVLFTGEGEDSIAIKAFNEGLIDAYLRKDDPDFITEIEKIEKELEWRYFESLSHKISGVEDFSYLSNERLRNKFSIFFNQAGNGSFCISDIQGNFNWYDHNQHKAHILVRRKVQLDELANAAEEDGASIDTLNKLRSGKVIPFFGQKSYWEIPASEWDAYLHEAECLSENDDIYWVKIDVAN
jgi:CheY-like chemotaxis protein